jgi:F0F1-type ATP synthase membrane subunit b/b'
VKSETRKQIYFNDKDTLGELRANPQTEEIVEAIIKKARASRGDVAKSTECNANLEKMMAGMKLDSLLKQAGDAVSKEAVKALNAALQKVQKE